MHGAIRSKCESGSGNKLSSLPSSRYLVAAGAMLVLAATVPSLVQLAFAQTPAPPAVHVQRNQALDQRVWPADLNRDGITDLVSSSPRGNVQVSIGKGDGSFNAPVESSVPGTVLGTGDFNGDQQLDVVCSRGAAQGTSFLLLPGTGTAALGSAVAITSPVQIDFVFALSADLNGDGLRDLVLPGFGLLVNVYPGNGNFTFGTPTTLATNGVPVDGILADLNNDGRRDLVTANGEFGTLSVFLNLGSLMFSSSDLPQSQSINDVTVADFNRDGRPDLLAAAGRSNSGSGFGEGFVFAFRGNGDGTFAAPAAFPVATGPMQIVAGDFNRDGTVDVATGNRSTLVRDDCTAVFKTWDSLSILPGLANGTFSAPSTFSIGDQSLMDPSNNQTDRYRNTLSSLNTSDLNGDRATDLISSYGAILFNVAPVPNRPPTVNAGPDRVLLNTHEVVLRPAASDPDDDMLTYEIRNAAGFLVATYPNACTSDLDPGDNTFTVTVNDGHGHSDSDTAVYTVINTDEGVGQFSAGNDIGRVAAAGSDAYDSTTDSYTVRGSGGDIWGTADEFHYVWTLWGGDFQITALVDSVQNVNAWTKAGIMIRENLNPGARHASLFATPGKGVAFQRRTAANGGSVHTPGPATTAPVWLKLLRTGDVITAYYRKATTDAWTALGQETLTDLSPDTLVGLAVGSHVDGTVASASFSRVVLQGALPLTGRPIGAGSGSVVTDGVAFTITGQGADIWGTADAFYYVAMPWQNDLTITARVRSIANANAWAKAGVMVRENLTPGSRHVMAVVTPGKGVAMQYRSAPGAASLQAANLPGAAPAWVRLSLAMRSGVFTAWWSSDGEHWTTLGSVTVPFSATTFYIGLPVTSHTTAASTSAVVDDVALLPFTFF